MRMAELGTIDEEVDNNPGALSEVEKETVLHEVSWSMSEVDDKNPGALTEVQMETILPVVSQKIVKNLSEPLTSQMRGKLSYQW